MISWLGNKGRGLIYYKLVCIGVEKLLSKGSSFSLPKKNRKFVIFGTF